MSKKRCILIDGSSYLFRAYHALPPLTNPDGQPTGAMYGCLNMLKKLLKEEAFDYIAVVFDSRGPTTRHGWFPEYKANRPEMAEDLASQIEPLQQMIEALGVPLVKLVGIEADDIIGTLAREALDHDMEVLISTGDKDFAQLVGPHLSLVNTMSNTRLDREGVFQKFGVYPEQIIDYLALMGDTVDNIPGVQKVGPKTAAKWLAQYGTLDKLLEAQSEISGKIGEYLREAVPTLPLSKRLVTIMCHEALPVQVTHLVRTSLDVPVLREMFTRYAFKQWLSELPAAPTPATHANGRLISFEAAPKTVETCWFLKHQEEVWIGFLSEKAAGLDVIVVSGPAAWTWITTRAERRVGLDVKHMARHFQWPDIDGMRDVRIDAYVLNPNQSFILPPEPPETDPVAAMCVFKTAAEELETPEATPTSVRTVLETIEMPLIPVLYRMERAGVLLDVELLMQHSARLHARLEKLTEAIYHLAGRPFNIQSPKQLQVVLFEDLKLPIHEKTPTGQPSTSEEVLEQLALSHPLPQSILEYRTLAKLKSTYTDSLPQQLSPITHRLHTTFQQTVTATGRLSSTDPNVQNIPIRHEEGRLIREAFIAKPGFVLLSADYSQIELRIMAHWSSDPKLIEAFRLGEDVHRATASMIFGIPVSEIDDDERRFAKTVNFGLLYGMSAFGLARALKVTRKEAEGFIERYFETFPKVKSYMEHIRQEAETHGFVETLFGRRLYVPEIHSKNFNVKQGAIRAAINAPMQGSASDIIKRAMIELDAWCQNQDGRVVMLLQVHDELLFEVRLDVIESAKAHIRTTMEEAAKGILQVPLVVECGVGANWKLAH